MKNGLKNQLQNILNSSWKKFKVKDEPVIQSNDSLAISFARSGIDSHTTQIFINLKKNHRLDTIDYNSIKGFSVIAKVINGMQTMHQFYITKDDVPDQDSIQKYGNIYLERKYPKLDYIKKAYIIK